MRHRRVRAAAVGLLLVVLPAVVHHDARAAAPPPAAWDLVGAINAERFHLGLPPLAYLSAIDDMAVKQANAIADAQRLFHNANLDGDLAARVRGWMRVGENVGYASTVGALHGALMDSPPHRANILGDYNYVAVGVVQRDGRLWAAQVFAKAPEGLPVITRVPMARVLPASNVEASVSASQLAFPAQGSSSVVVARQDVFADSLAGGALAGAGAGPVLLSPRDAPAAILVAEARRVLRPGGTVFLMGGPAALSPAIEASFRDAGLRTERIAGANRFETAALAATRINPDPTLIVLVSGIAFADAMTATPVAVKTKAPIILANGDDLPTESALYLNQHPAAARVVIGGTASVGNTAATLALATDRVAGADRFETAVRVAARWFGESRSMVLATGSTFQDSAIAGALSGRLGAPTILTSAPVTGPTYTFVRDRLRGLTGVKVVGTADEVTPSTVALLLS